MRVELFQQSISIMMRMLLCYRYLMRSAYLKEGGAATIAYAKLQFSHMSDFEREELKKALLKYCELDTLAMVMIVEAWQGMIKQSLP